MDKILAPIKNRILQFIDYKGFEKKYFFEKIDVSASNFRSKSLESEVGGDVIAKISSLYPELNLEWLLTGEGSMLKGGEGKEVAEAKEPDNKGNINDYLLEYIELLKEKLAKVEAELEEHRQRTKSAAAEAQRKSA